MSGTDLGKLLAAASPELNPRPVAVVALGAELPEALRGEMIGCFREAEGWTVYLDCAAAEAAGLPIAFRAAWITLRVESSLKAVEFTAVFSTALAKAGIACNAVAAAGQWGKNREKLRRCYRRVQ